MISYPWLSDWSWLFYFYSVCYREKERVSWPYYVYRTTSWRSTKHLGQAFNTRIMIRVAKKNYYKTVFNEENKQYETQSKDTVIPVSHVCRWYKINQRSCSTIPISDHIMRRIRMVGSIWQYDLSMCLLTCGLIYFAPVNFRKLGFCNTWS